MRCRLLSPLHRILHFLGHCIYLWLMTHYFALGPHAPVFGSPVFLLLSTLFSLPEWLSTCSRTPRHHLFWDFLDISIPVHIFCHVYQVSLLSVFCDKFPNTDYGPGTMSRAGCSKLHIAWDLVGGKEIDRCQVIDTAGPHHQSLPGSRGPAVTLQSFRSWVWDRVGRKRETSNLYFFWPPLHLNPHTDFKAWNNICEHPNYNSQGCNRLPQMH